MAAFKPGATQPDNVTDRGKVQRVRLTGTGDTTETLEWVAAYLPGGTDVAVADGGTGASTAAGARTNLGLVIGTDVQAQDAELSALAGLVSAADSVPYFTGAGTAALATVTAAARTVLDDTTTGAMLTTLGAQPVDADLTAIAALVSAADKFAYATGAGTWALADLTAAGRALLDDVAASNQRATLGLVIGTDVQAYDADLAALAAIVPAQGDVIYHNGTAWVRLAAGISGQFLRTAGAAANPAWATIPGGGDLLAANNLSDLASVATARTNLNVDKRTGFADVAYTVLTTDKYVAQTGTLTLSRAITLPAASAVNAGRELIIADESGSVTATNTLVITRAGTDTIDGATTETISVAYGARKLTSDGVSKWKLTGFWPTPAGHLTAANNLSDVANAATARTNLGLGTAATAALGAAAGNALAVNTVDAKGDLLVGTAADTIARLAVGATNGHVLTVDSVEATGLKWAAAAGGGSADPLNAEFIISGRMFGR